MVVAKNYLFSISVKDKYFWTNILQIIKFREML